MKLTINIILLWVCAISANGATVNWVNGYGGTGSASASAVASDVSGNIFLAGELNGTVNFGGGNLSSSGGGWVLAKYNNAGVHQWSFGFNGTSGIIPTGIGLDSSGNIFVGGYFGGTANFGGSPITSAGQQDCFIAKYSSSGAYIWARTFGSTGSDEFLGLAVDPQGNPVVTGSFQGSVDFGSGVLQSRFGTQPNMMLAKYLSSNGTNVWSEVFLSNNHNAGRGICADSSNNILVTGDFAPAVDFGHGSLTNVAFNVPNIFVAKFNSSGSNIWAQRYGGTNGDKGTAIAVDGNGDAIVGGQFSHSTDLGGGTIIGTGFYQDLFLAKYSVSNGSYVWGLGLFTIQDGWVSAISTDTQKNIVLTGYYEGTLKLGNQTLSSVGGSFDIFAAKYMTGSASGGGNIPGSLVWANSFGGTSSDQGIGVTIDPTGKPDLTGVFVGTATFGGTTLTSAGPSSAYLLQMTESASTATNYYIDSSKTGSSSNTGLSPANAFTNWVPLGGLDGQWTSVMKGGDTLWIFPGVGYIGNKPASPDAIVMFNILGAPNKPITFKAVQTNGLVKLPPVVNTGSFFTWDGRLSDTYTNVVNFDNMANLFQITNNINLWIRGVYGFGSNVQNGIYCPNSGLQMKFTWLHVDPFTFNTNNYPFGNNSTGPGSTTHGINILQNTGENLTGMEIGYCYIEEADQCCVNILNNNLPSWSQGRIHHNVMTKQGDAGARLAGGFEVDHNIIGVPWTIHGHPNGIVQAPSYSLFHHNIVLNTLDTMMYTPGGGSPMATGIKVYNNLLYTTKDWSFIYTNQFSSGLPFVNHSVGGLQFLVEANANNFEPWLPQVWTNFVFAGNTMITGYGAVATNANGGINSAISLPNRYAPGNSLSVDPGLDRGFINITNMLCVNNLIYNVSPAGSGQTLGGWPGWVDRFNSNPSTWSNNAVTATAGILFDPSNTGGANTGSTNVLLDYSVLTADQAASKAFAYNGPFSTNSTFAKVEDFDTAYTTNGYIHNSSSVPALVDTNNYAFAPKVSDTVLIGKGTNLSGWALAPGGLPQYNMDLAGQIRPSTPSIGAFEPDYSMILHYTFEDLAPPSGPVLGVSPQVQDITGYNSQMLYWGFISTPTNWPVRVAYTNSIGGFSSAAQFVSNTNAVPAYNNFSIAQFGGITNIGPFSNLQAISVCVWAKYASSQGDTRDNVATIIDTCEGSPGAGATWSLGRNSAFQTSFDLFTNLNYNTSGTLHLNYPDNESVDWHFYVATFNCTNQIMNIYLDGTNCGSRNLTGYSTALTNLIVGVPSSGGSYGGKNGWISIGCRTHVGSPQLDDGDQFPNNGWFDGQISDLRTYNRDLAAGEVLALYNRGGPPSVAPAQFTPPVITQQPNSTNIFATQSALFTIAISGTVPFHYQWMTNGVAAGTNGPALSVGPAPVAWSGMTIVCVITNSVGTATSATATLTVGADPVITGQPANVTVAVGGTASFTVVATGQSPLTFQWVKNGSSIGGATQSSYTTPATVNADNNSHFLCTVTDTAGSTNSATATLTVTGIVGPDPLITSQPQSISIFANQSTTFSVTATGTALHYQWKTNGVNTGTDSNTLPLGPCPVAWSGIAVLVVVSGSGPQSPVTSSTATLTVGADPVITVQPQNITVPTGATATFSVTSTGQTPRSNQWSRNGSAIAGATSSSYTTPQLIPSNNGDAYFVDVTDTAGTLRSATATLTVLTPPPPPTSIARVTNLRVTNATTGP